MAMICCLMPLILEPSVGFERRPGERCQRLSGQTESGPFSDRFGPELPIELHGPLVPGQDRPAHFRPATRHGDLRQPRHQPTSDPSTPPRRLDEYVFEIEPGPSCERRE